MELEEGICQHLAHFATQFWQTQTLTTPSHTLWTGCAIASVPRAVRLGRELTTAAAALASSPPSSASAAPPLPPTHKRNTMLVQEIPMLEVSLIRGGRKGKNI